MLTLVIQAGGESRRMGRNKALAPFLGRPLLLRVIERLAGLGDEVLLTTNEPELYSFLKGISLVPDVLPGRGALGGLYTALSAAHYPLVAVAACDMPFASRDLLQAEREMLEREKMDVVIPRTEEGMEPFHAVYRRDACLQAVEAALAAGEKRMISWFPKVRVKVLDAEIIRQYDPLMRAFLNVNTPKELEQAEAAARES